MEAMTNSTVIFWYTFYNFFIFNSMFSFFQCRFFVQFTLTDHKKIYCFFYILITYIVSYLGMQSTVSQDIATLEGILIVFLFLRLVLRQTTPVSLLTAILAITINVLVECIYTPFIQIGYNLVSSVQGTILINSIHNLVMLLLTVLFYRYFVRRHSLKQNRSVAYLSIITAPLLFITVTMRMLLETKYQPNVFSTQITNLNDLDYQFLFIAVLALICVCVCLYAFEKASSFFQAENEKKALEHQLLLQQKQTEELKSRYQLTRAFRHDFNNHIVVLKGLLSKGEMEKAAAYLEEFVQISDRLSFPVQTGNTALDVLLMEKLALAQQAGIQISCEVDLPGEISIQDFDLCAIFANAIDNSIKACLQTTNPWITLKAKKDRHFILIMMTNNYESGKTPKGLGLGLISLENIATHYNGTMETEEDGKIYRLSLLLPFSERIS